MKGFFGKGLYSKGPPRILSEYLRSNYNISIVMEDRVTNNDRNDDEQEPIVLSLCEVGSSFVLHLVF